MKLQIKNVRRKAKWIRKWISKCGILRVKWGISEGGELTITN
jgi:hypothetical protein